MTSTSNHRRTLLCAIALAAACVWTASPARADIDEWAWVNQADPSLGIYQSSIVCPGGSGVNATPGATLDSLNLTQAYLVYANLSHASLYNTNLTDAAMNGASFAYANLTDANLSSGTLTSADFTGATVVGANFNVATMGLNPSPSGETFRIG